MELHMIVCIRAAQGGCTEVSPLSPNPDVIITRAHPFCLA